MVIFCTVKQTPIIGSLQRGPPYVANSNPDIMAEVRSVLFIRFDERDIWEVDVLLISLPLSLYSIISGLRIISFVSIDS